jgi:hypothetical protein
MKPKNRTTQVSVALPHYCGGNQRRYVRFVPCASLAHLRLVRVPLVQPDDAAERARDVREQPFCHLKADALGLQDRGVGAAE